METYINLWYLNQFFSEWTMLHTMLVEKTKTLIIFSVPFGESRAVYEMMWNNMTQPDKKQNTTK